jgi:hypothetical protein
MPAQRSITPAGRADVLLVEVLRVLAAVAYVASILGGFASFAQLSSVAAASAALTVERRSAASSFCCCVRDSGSLARRLRTRMVLVAAATALEVAVSSGIAAAAVRPSSGLASALVFAPYTSAQQAMDPASCEIVGVEDANCFAFRSDSAPVFVLPMLGSTLACSLLNLANVAVLFITASAVSGKTTGRVTREAWVAASGARGSAAALRAGRAAGGGAASGPPRPTSSMTTFGSLLSGGQWAWLRPAGPVDDLGYLVLADLSSAYDALGEQSAAASDGAWRGAERSGLLNAATSESEALPLAAQTSQPSFDLRPLLLLRYIGCALLLWLAALAIPGILFALPVRYFTRFDDGGDLAFVSCGAETSGVAALSTAPFFLSFFSSISSVHISSCLVAAALLLIPASAACILPDTFVYVASSDSIKRAAGLAQAEALQAAVASGIERASTVHSAVRQATRVFVAVALAGSIGLAPALTAWLSAGAYTPFLASWLVFANERHLLAGGWGCGPCLTSLSASCTYSFLPDSILALLALGGRAVMSLNLFLAVQASSDLISLAGGLCGIVLRARVQALLEGVASPAAARPAPTVGEEEAKGDEDPA